MTARVLPALALLLGLAATANAQYYDNNYYHASTAGESYARGMADYVRSAGMYNLSTSAAAINVEQARSQNIDNQLKYTQMYFDRKRVNQAYMDSQKGPRPTAQDIHRMAAAEAPKRMTPSEVDPLTGSINWPPVLGLDAYAEDREKINAMFDTRATGAGQTSPQDFMTIQQLTSDMLDSLKANIRLYQPQDYVEARKFLERLNYEARFPSS